jgi:hypothetical protein
MQKMQRLDHFLPTRFKRGTVVKQFSKPCINCGQMLQASQMHGIARLLDDHLALAATAKCPSCDTRFEVSCVIDSEKRVRRVVLPSWLYKLYLRTIPLQPGERAAHDEAQAQLSREDGKTASPSPEVHYPRASVSLGQYQGKPIPAYILVCGREVPFDRIAPDGRATSGEYVIDGLFVYKPA